MRDVGSDRECRCGKTLQTSGRQRTSRREEEEEKENEEEENAELDQWSVTESGSGHSYFKKVPENNIKKRRKNRAANEIQTKMDWIQSNRSHTRVYNK